MIDVPDAPKRLEQVDRPERHSSPANRQSQGNGKSKSALPRYLLVLILSWGSTWAFGTWEPRASTLAGESASGAQSAEPAAKPDTQCSASCRENPASPGGRSPEASNHAVNPQVWPSPAKEVEKQSSAGPPQEVWYERPSLQRAKARLEESVGLVSSPPADAEMETGRAQGHPRRSRSAARSIALADLSERLPPTYFGKDIRAQGAAAARQSGPPPSPEPTGRGEEETDVARKSPSDKTKDPGQPLGFSEIPSQMRDSIPMSISMLVYSRNVEERWAKINGAKLQEGQELSPGLRLEAITPEGIIFDYKGTRFYKAVKDD
jgi:hypothetical protein